MNTRGVTIEVSILWSVIFIIVMLNFAIAAPLPPTENYARTVTADVAVDNPRVLRLIYFMPNDRQFDDEVIQNMKNWILTTQTFYAEQMEAHGYGRKTFQLETDAQGEPIIHRIVGKHPYDNYQVPLRGAVRNEVSQIIDLKKNIALIITPDNVTYGIGESRRHGKNSAYVTIRAESDWETVAHLLGNAFGLWYDNRDNEYIMSYRRRGSRLSACHAQFLSVHPFFNSDISLEDGLPPVIELLSPRTYPTGSESISIQLRISDGDGIRQAVLLDPQKGFWRRQIKTCLGLSGEIFTTVDFDYDATIPSNNTTKISDKLIHEIFFQVVDMAGNESIKSFTFVEKSPHHITSLEWGPHPVEGHRLGVGAMSFSPDGSIIAGGTWDGVRLWEVETREHIATLEHDSGGDALVFSPDGSTLAVETWRNNVTLWNMTTREKITTLKGHTRPIEALALSPDGKILASGGWDGTIKLWDMETNGNTATLSDNGSGILSLSFSPDGKTLASGHSGSDSAVKLWDIETREIIATLTGGRGHIYTVLFLSNEILATGDYGEVKLWDVATHQQIATLPLGSSIFPRSMTLSPNRKILACVGSHINDEGVLQLWHIETRRRIASFAHTAPLRSVSFSSDEMTIAASTSRGTVELWDIAKWLSPDFKVLLGYTWSVPSGSSFIHLPLEVTSVDGVETIVKSVSDIYDILGAEKSVNFLAFYDTDAQEWLSYVGNQDKGTTRDKELTDYQGILAILNKSVSVELEGYALGIDGTNSIVLRAGINLVGLPLRDSRINIVSDLLTIDGIKDNVSSVLVSDNGIFKLVAEVGDNGDTTIDGGQSFLVAEKDSTVTLSGNGWNNSVGAAPAITIAKDTQPVEPVLLPNYPNPFNPETWIPYYLANDADVHLTIYDISGMVVRQLDLGYQQAGYYTDRAKAVHWDGRNSLGEVVGSGVYFYQLRVGDFSQIRKMVIIK